MEQTLMFPVDKKFVGERLKNARQLRGLTLTELALRTGISKQSLSLYENSKNIPEYERVENLAIVLNFPQDFFFQKDIYRTNTEVTYFRSLATATKIDRIAQSLKLEYVAIIYESLLDYIDFPDRNFPEISFNETDDEFDDEGNKKTCQEIERLSNEARAFWGVGNRPIANLQYLLEKNGIIVTGFDTLEEKIDAFSQRTVVNDSDLFIIALSIGKRPECRIRFDMAHELGHILLHPWSEDLESITKEEFKSREKQANMFASAFLLPQSSFGTEAQPYPTDLKYYLHLKKKWNVSIQAMVYRTRQLGIISDNQFQYLMRQISKNGWRMREPTDAPYYLNENIFQGAIDLLIQNSIMSASSILRLFARSGVTMNREDIENLLHLRDGTLLEQKSHPQIIQLKPPNSYS